MKYIKLIVSSIVRRARIVRFGCEIRRYGDLAARRGILSCRIISRRWRGRAASYITAPGKMVCERRRGIGDVSKLRVPASMRNHLSGGRNGQHHRNMSARRQDLAKEVVSAREIARDKMLRPTRRAYHQARQSAINGRSISAFSVCVNRNKEISIL